MKKSMLWTRKILVPMLLALVLGIVIVSVGTASPIPSINQANSVTTVYLDPPTINGTVSGQEFNVSIMIRYAPDMQGWQAGMIFDAALLECTGFYEGEFLKGPPPERTTMRVKEGTINNTAGVITYYAYTIIGEMYTSGDGRLAYATFKVKASGVSDLHLRDVKLSSWVYVAPGEAELVTIPTNIIDVYTVVVGATSHTVVTVSNSTGMEPFYIDTTRIVVGSGFSDHDFNMTLEEISFKVKGPHPGFSNVTIPKALLSPEPPRVWATIINGTARFIETPKETPTHTSIYFTYPKGLYSNNIQITTRLMSSTISIDLSEDSIPLGESVTISGNVTAADDTMRPNINVTIHNRMSGKEKWGKLARVKTDSNGIYSYDWEPETTGTYEVMASWEGDVFTTGAESEVKSLEVKGAPGIDPMLIVAVAVAVILIIAIVVYFVKFRKS